MLAGIAKTGPGTVQLNGQNYLYGGVTVNGGVLDLDSSRVLTGAPLTVNAGGTVQYENGEPLAGNGNPYYFSMMTVNGGTVQMNNTNANNYSDILARLDYLGGTINAPTQYTLQFQPTNYGTALLLNGDTLSGRFEVNNTWSVVQTQASRHHGRHRRPSEAGQRGGL